MKSKTGPSLMRDKYFSMLLSGTLTMMVVSVTLMSDTLIAGVFIGADAVKGITLVTPLYSIGAFFGSVFSLGVPILYSAEMGRFQKDEADRIFGFGFLMSLITGIVLFLLVLLFGDFYLRMNNPTPEVYQAARDYLAFIRFTVLVLPVDMLIAACVYSDGDETISSVANIVQGVGNLVASLLLARIMGVRGIGLASFLFYAISLGVLFLHFMKKSNSLKIGFYYSGGLYLRVLRYSIIDASTYLFIGILVAALNFFVSTRYGAQALILVSVISLSRELQMLFDGIGEAISPIITIYLSENCTPGVRATYDLAKKTAIAEGMIVTLVMCAAAPVVPAVLQIPDDAYAQMAVTGLRIVSTGSVFVSLLYLMTSYDLLIEKIPLGLAASALRDVIISVPLSVILGFFFGPCGMFAGFAISPALALFLYHLYLQKKHPGDTPLLLGDRKNLPSFLYNLKVEQEAVVRTRDEIGQMLREHSLDDRTVNRVMLLFEELFMMINERNGSRTVIGECGILLMDGCVRMIVRDTGQPFDITDADMAVSSLRSYVVSNVAESVSPKKTHLSAMSFNRNVFELLFSVPQPDNPVPSYAAQGDTPF